MESSRWNKSTEFPKLANKWGGSFEQISADAVLVYPIASDGEPIQVQFDALITIASKLENEPMPVRIKTVVRKKKHEEKIRR